MQGQTSGMGRDLKFGCLVDRKRKRFRHRQPVVILGRRIALAVEHLRWGG
jgi:hypothetical protein